jgi:hypothetical protein
MKVLERVIGKRVRSKASINDMQFVFMPARGATDAMFFVKQIQERFLEKKRTCGRPLLTLKKRWRGYQGR